MSGTHLSYEIQELRKGDWVGTNSGADRQSIIRWAHQRATGSQAPPMRVVERQKAAGDGDAKVVYRSWCPQDWPTSYPHLWYTALHPN